MAKTDKVKKEKKAKKDKAPKSDKKLAKQVDVMDTKTDETPVYTFKTQTPEHKAEMKIVADQMMEELGLTPDEIIDVGDWLLNEMSVAQLKGEEVEDVKKQPSKKKGTKKSDASDSKAKPEPEPESAPDTEEDEPPFDVEPAKGKGKGKGKKDKKSKAK